jgi:hypothetical protein
MLTLLSRLFVCLALCSLFFVRANSQTSLQSEDQDTIKLKTDLVVVDALARDKKSREIIRGLKLQDFELFEDGAKQQIEYFGQDKLPRSGGHRGTETRRVRRGLRQSGISFTLLRVSVPLWLIFDYANVRHCTDSPW